jgi:anti-sigma28 factor (negative regulator of flagellin synthesis)
MKINGTTQITGIQSYDRDGRGAAKRAAQQDGNPAGRVSISPAASFVSSVQAEAADAGESTIRQDLVSDIKAQLQAGTFEQGINMDKVLDSLLADL